MYLYNLFAISLVFWLSVILSQCNCDQQKQQPPNIVFILADDLGWNDIGFNNPAIKTPVLDGLAKEGVILDQSYVQPVCSPSRSALMTGVYPFRLGLQHMVIMNRQPVCVPLDRQLLPEVFKTAGYATHIVGKWHLGFCNVSCTPTYRGFDSFYGYYTGREDHYSKVSIIDPQGYDFRDGMEVDRSAAGTYSTYLFTDRIKKIISNHEKKKPLFLYLPFQNTHRPVQVPKKYENMYSGVKDDYRRKFSGMVSCLDEAVGEVVEALKAKGLYENTLLVFSSDNGGSVAYGGNNFPLRGGKMSVFEGGTRAVGFVHGPMFKNKGERYKGLMHIVDWFPTLVEAAGISYKGYDQDGVSQWSSLTSLNLPSKRKEVVYNLDDHPKALQGKTAIRVGDYKLVDGYPGLFPDWYRPAQISDSLASLINRTDAEDDFGWDPAMNDTDADTKNVFLFNLKADPNERVNLASKRPGLVQKLRARLNVHRKKMVPANFPPNNDHRADPSNFDGAWSPGWC